MTEPHVHDHVHTHTHDGHTHTHTRDDAHAHNHEASNHDSGRDKTSRRDFMRVLMGGALAGASALEARLPSCSLGTLRATNERRNPLRSRKAADGVYFAHARPQTVINCNAAIFVRSKDVVVVDAHSKPSAAESIVRQIRHEITDKPVRYVINTHFHWDHTQGDHGYRMAGENVDFIASSMTKNSCRRIASTA